MLTDEPYNVTIGGHVTKGNHREFAMASGEMSGAEFTAFNSAWMSASIAHLCDGGLIGTFIDWRGYPVVHAAATGHGLSDQSVSGQKQMGVWAVCIGRSTSSSRSTRRAPLSTSTISSSGRTAVGARMSGFIPAPPASAQTAARA